MARKALGRGLGALLRDEPKSASDEQLVELDIDVIEPNSEQPRSRFEDDALEELAQSIRANGIVQPVIVRPKGSGYQLVAGERRWRAAQRAGLKRIAAIVKQVADDKLLELALIENIQRQELNPIEEARAYRNLIDSVGLTQESIAERVGRSRTAVTTSLRLLKLPKDIQNLIEEGKISAGHARALLMTAEEDLQRRLARKIIELALSVREAEKAVKRARGKSTQNTASKAVTRTLDANARAALTKLRRHFGTQVQIHPDRKGEGGKIEIEYYSETDLDRIYRLIIGKK